MNPTFNIIRHICCLGLQLGTMPQPRDDALLVTVVCLLSLTKNTELVSEKAQAADITSSGLFSKCQKLANWQLADCCRHINCNYGPKTEFFTRI